MNEGETRGNGVTYSTYEAKAKFSEIMRKVRDGQRVIISYRGEEVAEVRPYRRAMSNEEAFAELVDRGVLLPATERRGDLAPIARRPGALARFLESRE